MNIIRFFRLYSGRPATGSRSALVRFTLLLALFSSPACRKEKPLQEGCPSVAATGRLTQAGPAGPFTYRTSGGGIIEINPKGSIALSHKQYPWFKIEVYGTAELPGGQSGISGNHQALNGKHLRDRAGSRSTFIFPDGAKLTLEAEGEAGPLISVTLYDGPESHRILFACNALSHSAISEAQTRELDAVEPDGEAAGIEFSGTWVRLVQLYTESTPGNKVHQRFLLAEISRDQPTWVIDHYDDPRLDHT